MGDAEHDEVEWVHSTTFELGSATFVGCGVLRTAGQRVSREAFRMGSQRMNAGKRKSYRKAMVPFGELELSTPVERSKDKGQTRNRVGICWLLWTDLTRS